MSLWPLWGLVFARAAGVLALAPPTGWRHFPVSLRLAVAALVAVPVTLALQGPSAEGPAISRPAVATVGRLIAGPSELPQYVAAALHELALGLLLGLPLWLLIWAAFAAGHLADLAGGFAAGDEEEGPLANLFYVVAVLFFLQLNGHHWLLAFFRHSYALGPVGHGPDVMQRAVWLYWPAALFAGMIQLAAPLVLSVFLAALLVGSLQRALPDIAVGQALPAARAVVTLLALVILAPLLGAVFLQQISAAAGLMAGWLTGS